MKQSIGVLLLPGFSDWAYSSVIQFLKTVNRISNSIQYQITSLSCDATKVASDNSINVFTEDFGQSTTAFDTIIIIAGADTPTKEISRVARANQHRLGQPTLWMGIEYGIQVMVSMGILDGYRVSWEARYLMPDYSHRIHFSAKPYILDRDRLTCRDRQYVFPSLLGWLSREHGFDVGQRVKDYLQTELRYNWPNRYHQMMADDVLSSGSDCKLNEALELMHSNLSEPLSKNELASHIGISCRQMERLFNAHLKVTPSRYYMMIRLEAVKRALHSSRKSLAELADQFGFSSGAHLSTCYKRTFLCSPSQERP